MDACAHTDTHEHTDRHTHAHTHTHTQACTHTHTYTHIRLLPIKKKRFKPVWLRNQTVLIEGKNYIGEQSLNGICVMGRNPYVKYSNLTLY